MFSFYQHYEAKVVLTVTQGLASCPMVTQDSTNLLGSLMMKFENHQNRVLYQTLYLDPFVLRTSLWIV